MGIQVLKKAASQKAVNTNWDVGKFKNQLPSIRADAGGIERALRKIDYEGANYCKYELLIANQQHLPLDQWTPMDSDHNYLEDHISDVKNEEYEKNLMKSALLDFDSYTDRLFMIPFRVTNYVAIQKLRATLNKQFHVENPLI